MTNRFGKLRPLGLALSCAALGLCLSSCVQEVTLEEKPDPTEVAVGEVRTVEMRHWRFDVKKFEMTLDLEALKGMPEKVLRETWMVDLDVRPLIINSLDKLLNMNPEEVDGLPDAEYNMYHLLTMTADSADLRGTSLEALLEIGEGVGLAPSRVLADLVEVDEDEPIIPLEMIADAVIENLIQTHPSAQFRRGPVTDEHPDGLYPVTPGTLPVSMWDVVTDFAELPIQFGPANVATEYGYHPGFIADTSGLKATTDDFQMAVQVDLNAFSFEALDLSTTSIGAVNSTASQIRDVFDFNNPDWLKLEGLKQDLVIDELTMSIFESPTFISGGTSKEPAPLGNSAVWERAPWEFERLLADVAVLRASGVSEHCSVYQPEGTLEEPFDAVQACFGADAWVSIAVDQKVELDQPPPPPSYFWDMLLEIAQSLLHNGGIAEGAGSVALTLRDIPTGVDTEELVNEIKGNIMTNPEAMADFAALLNDSHIGDPDFYYYVPRVENSDDIKGDYLYFITPRDLRTDDNGFAVRPYGYQNPGFFSDRALLQKVSRKDLNVDGDVVHEKVKISPGDVLYMQDDAARVFKLSVNEKPSKYKISIDIERVE